MGFGFAQVAALIRVFFFFFFFFFFFGIAFGVVTICTLHKTWIKELMFQDSDDGECIFRVKRQNMNWVENDGIGD